MTRVFDFNKEFGTSCSKVFDFDMELNTPSYSKIKNKLTNDNQLFNWDAKKVEDKNPGLLKELSEIMKWS